VASPVFPSTSAIDGLVRINQMGASCRTPTSTGSFKFWPRSPRLRPALKPRRVSRTSPAPRQTSPEPGFFACA
jgi:hypothetical protein